MLPGDVVTLTTDQLASLREPCRRQLPDLADAVEALEESLKAHEDGGTFRMPTLKGLGGQPAQEVLEGLARDRDDPRVSEAAAALLYLAGREVLTHRSHREKVTSELDYRDALPADIAPIVILYASGRVRHTYRLWEQHRGDLVRLEEATKDYGDLRVKVWARGGGKGSWARHGDVLLQGIAAAINTKPEERWLIIHHKDSLGGKLRQRVEDLVTAPRESLCYVQWGSHHGINDYADISNVILAGTLFLREQTYEALARLAADMLAHRAPDRRARAAVRPPVASTADIRGGWPTFPLMVAKSGSFCQSGGSVAAHRIAVHECSRSGSAVGYAPAWPADLAVAGAGAPPRPGVGRTPGASPRVPSVAAGEQRHVPARRPGLVQ